MSHIDVPAWVRDTVFYQVFPDRFATSERVEKPGPFEAWDAPPTHFGYKGGDLLGLAERLDELADLGIGAIYLNPVFAAASNHRYNAYDYLSVDPVLGGDAALRELLDAAHDRSIRVILDGVFNHCGRGFWAFHHVLEAGGASPYRDWFYLDKGVLSGRRGLKAYSDEGPVRRPGYRGWWGLPSLPKLRVEHPAVRAYLFGVAEHWLRFGIDGWRLDVPHDIEDETFWPEFRERVRSVRPDAYLVGEIWDEAPSWLLGDRFDALMNYPLAVAILGFVGGQDLDRKVIDRQSNYRKALVALDGPAFGATLERLMGLYDPAVTAAQFNLISSHDTPRARSVLGGSGELLRLATVLQLTLPGAPSIYYGDELGMEGRADPDCRRGYPPNLALAGEETLAMRAFVRALVAARHQHVALRRGSVRVVAAAERAMVLEREAEGQRAIVAVNAGREAVRFELPNLDGLRPLDLPGTAARDGGDGLPLGPGQLLVAVDDGAA